MNLRDPPSRRLANTGRPEGGCRAFDQGWRRGDAGGHPLDSQLRPGGGRRSAGDGLRLPGEQSRAIREHASRAGLPVDEIISVADTVVVRPDPEKASA